MDIRQFHERYNAKGVLKFKMRQKAVFQLLTREETERLAGETGFTVRGFYGNFDRSAFDKNASPFMIYILERI